MPRRLPAASDASADTSRRWLWLALLSGLLALLLAGAAMASVPAGSLEGYCGLRWFPVAAVHGRPAPGADCSERVRVRRTGPEVQPQIQVVNRKS